MLVVAEREATTLDEMRRMSAVLRRLGAPVVGVALTDGGLEIYDWGLADSELQEGGEPQQEERDPTEQLPVSTAADVDPTSPLDEMSVSVVEHTQREA